MKTGPNQKPPPHPMYGDTWERGLDPWHANAFPDEFKDRAPNQGEQKGGWYLNDAWGNQIMFIQDGTEVEYHKKQ